MNDVTPANSIAGPVLKDKRAYWLYQVPIIGLTLLPLIVVVLIALFGSTLQETVVTILGTLAATALGGLVNMITAGKPDGQ